MAPIPANFRPLSRRSPFLETLGPFYDREERGGVVLGIFVAEKHCNARGTVHGGLLSTIADIALGYNMAVSREPPVVLTTANISIDFINSARLGEWIEAYVDILKVGRRLAFAQARLMVDDRQIARASGVFARTGDLDELETT